MKLDDLVNITVLKRVTDEFDRVARRSVTHNQLKDVLSKALGYSVDVDLGETQADQDAQLLVQLQANCEEMKADVSNVKNSLSAQERHLAKMHEDFREHTYQIDSNGEIIDKL